MSKKLPSKARLKLVAVGSERLLLVRFVPFSEHVQRTLGLTLREAVPEDALSFDGEVFRFRGNAVVEKVLRQLRGRCDLVYDPNLLRALPAMPNPWSIPAEPPRDWNKKPIVYMARVWHPDMAESLAFQSVVHDDDFLIDFKKELADAKRWRMFRRDLDNVPVWVVADHYAPRAHDVLDRYYDCWWDEFLAGEEWDVLPPPPNTQYPVRTLTAQDFLTLGIAPYCGLEDINAAYRERKEAYLENRIPVEEWLDVDVAYQRIRRHHFPAS